MSGKMISGLRILSQHSFLDVMTRSLNQVTTVVVPPPTRCAERVLVLHAHPYGKERSYTLALGKAVSESLEAAGRCVKYLCVLFVTTC